MESLVPILFSILLLFCVFLLPAGAGLLGRFFFPKMKREELAGLFGLPFLLILLLCQKEKLQAALSTCFEGAGLPPVDSKMFLVLLAGAISIYLLDLFLFFIIFRTMAVGGIVLADKINCIKSKADPDSKQQN